MIPRITTRGYYDRRTGRRIVRRDYGEYPRGLVGSLRELDEFVVVVHGMRNDSAGAAAKVSIATEALAGLGYDGKIIGFSYDADVINGHKRGNLVALRVARDIATENGQSLAKFINDMVSGKPRIRIRIIGHSLGSEVVVESIRHLAKMRTGPAIEAVYLFAASVSRSYVNLAAVSEDIRRAVRGPVTNYYYTKDEELQIGHDSGHNNYPIGLFGSGADTGAIKDVQVRPLNHRFTSYAAVLSAFP